LAQVGDRLRLRVGWLREGGRIVGARGFGVGARVVTLRRGVGRDEARRGRRRAVGLQLQARTLAWSWRLGLDRESAFGVLALEPFQPEPVREGIDGDAAEVLAEVVQDVAEQPVDALQVLAGQAHPLAAVVVVAVQPIESGTVLDLLEGLVDDGQGLRGDPGSRLHPGRSHGGHGRLCHAVLRVRKRVG
jgi:hypothetical protein